MRFVAVVAQSDPQADGAYQLAVYLVLDGTDLGTVAAEVNVGLPDYLRPTPLCAGLCDPAHRQRQGQHESIAGGQAARCTDRHRAAWPASHAIRSSRMWALSVVRTSSRAIQLPSVHSCTPISRATSAVCSRRLDRHLDQGSAKLDDLE